MLGFNKKTQDASPQENTGGENKVFHFIKTHKKRCIAVVAAAAVLVAVIVPRKSRSASADLAYTQEKLGRRRHRERLRRQRHYQRRRFLHRQVPRHRHGAHRRF